MAINYTCRVTTNGAGLNIRTGPSTGYPIIGSFPNGTMMTAVEESGGWYYIAEGGGWCCGAWITVTRDNGGSTATPVEPPAPKMSLAEQQDAYLKYLGENDSYDKSISQTLLVANMAGIHGMPYQFMNTVDRRIDGTNFGRTYADKIVSKMPLLLVTPGKANFMSEFKKSEKIATITKLIEGDSTEMSNILSGSGRYYTFDFDYVNYYSFVNGMCRTSARYLGIEDLVVNVGGEKNKLWTFDWMKATNDKFKSYINQSEFVAFYVDSASEVNESFSNSTTESQLASKVNSFSDLGRELSFLLGAGAGVTIDAASGLYDEQAFKASLDQVNKIADKYLNGNQVFKDLASNFSTVASGGKIMFPEIWADSEYSKTYNINMKLRTPDGDKLSWYMNICVPLCHLIALAAPQQMNANAYKGPFLIRAFYKGLFNCDMGIITSMDITKGKEGAWTIDGLPTEVDVSIQLKDLYQMLMITKGDDVGWFMNNTCLMDYLANNCGININKPELERTLDIYLMLKTNKIKNLPNKVWMSALQGVDNSLMDIYNNINRILR